MGMAKILYSHLQRYLKFLKFLPSVDRNEILLSAFHAMDFLVLLRQSESRGPSFTFPSCKVLQTSPIHKHVFVPWLWPPCERLLKS